VTLEPWQWALGVLAALIVGISKSGIGGLGILAVVLFTVMMPAKQATGTVLPLLCFGDIVASATYGRHAKWLHVWRLFPWTAGGVVLGWLAFDRVNDRQAQALIGAIILGLVVLQLVRRKWGGHEVEHGAWFAPTIGVLAGFTTLVANARHAAAETGLGRHERGVFPAAQFLQGAVHGRSRADPRDERRVQPLAGSRGAGGGVVRAETGPEDRPAGV
jgi:hypothetical protein